MSSTTFDAIKTPAEIGTNVEDAGVLSPSRFCGSSFE